MSWGSFFDYYSFRARLQPALFASLPVALAVFAWAPPGTKWVSALWSLIAGGGGTFFLATKVRNAGKLCEAALWKSWNGTPTTQLLTRGGPANPATRDHWHMMLEKEVNQPMPSAEEEAADLEGAKNRYSAAVKILISKRRDTKMYPLIFAENVNYGFCRNLYGIKSFGLTLGIAGTIISGLSVLNNFQHQRVDYLAWACTAGCLILSSFWISTINAEWVRIPAFAYANRLLESLTASDQLKKPKPKRVTKPKQKRDS